MGSRGSETENRAELKSDLKILGEKRTGGESGGDELYSYQKRLKMRDPKSVCRSDEYSSPSHHHESLKNKGGAKLHIHENDESRADKAREKTPYLNTDMCVVRRDKVHDDGCDECSKSDSDIGTSRCAGLDLNSEGVSSSMRMIMMMSSQQDPFFPYKDLNHAKSSRDVISECASSTGSLEESAPLKMWNEMKQNGFLSASHGGIPIPKQRGRKAKTEVLKKKMEIAKKEQVDRFTRIAAPSGLLNELNPGIINHVRNRKQVHSIIKALVRSEKHENSQAGTKPMGLLDEERQTDTASWVRQSREFSTSMVRCPSTIAEGKLVESDQVVLPVEERLALKTGASQSTVVHGEEGLALKLSSSTKLLENKGSSESQLSIKAATVASQWLELLSQDVKGRLAALRRSKKRLRAVISTELPFLLSKEFPSDEENNPFAARNSASAFQHFAAAEMHRARWNKLFDQIDESLSEEERQLESWLVQVKEMQIHCEHGLHQAHSNPLLGLGPSSDLRWGLHSDRAMAVRASAASIYSTCNFILTHSNVSCF